MIRRLFRSAAKITNFDRLFGDQATDALRFLFRISIAVLVVTSPASAAVDPGNLNSESPIQLSVGNPLQSTEADERIPGRTFRESTPEFGETPTLQHTENNATIAKPSTLSTLQSTEYAWFDRLKPVVQKYLNSSESATASDPVRYNSSKYVVVQVFDARNHYLDGGEVGYSFDGLVGYDGMLDNGGSMSSILVFKLGEQPSLVPKSNTEVIKTIVSSQSALEYTTTSDAIVSDEPNEWHVEYQKDTLSADLVNWDQELTNQLSERDRYLAALQAVAVTDSETIFIKDEWRDRISGASTAAESASTALKIASELEGQQVVRLSSGRTVDAALVRKVLNRYADSIKYVKKAPNYEGGIGFTASLADLVLTLTEEKIYSERQVEGLTRIQEYADSHENASLDPALDAAIDEMREQHTSSNIQYQEKLVKWIKVNGVDTAKYLAPKLATKFASWIVTKSTFAASVSSLVTSSTVVAATASAASLAGTAVFGFQLGGMLVGKSGMYTHMVRAKYARLASAEFDKIQQDIEAEYGDRLTGSEEYTNTNIGRTHLLTTELKYATLAEFYKEEYLTMGSFGPLGLNDWWYDTLNAVEGIASDLFGRDYVDEQEETLDLKEQKMSKVRDIRDTGLDAILRNYPSKIDEQPSQTPVNPTPTNGASKVDTDTTLSWETEDSLAEDVEFTIYLEAGDNTPDEKIGTTQSSTLDTSVLQAGTTYYWRVEAVDSNGVIFESEVWSFETKSTSTNSPSLSGPSSGVETVPYTFTAESSLDDTEIYYKFRWGDGTTTRFPSTGTVDSHVAADINHVWDSAGTYTVEVKTVTANGLESPWVSKTIEIDQAEKSDTVYAGRYVSGEADTTTSPPYSSYSIGDYTVKTVDHWDGTIVVDVYDSGSKEYNDVRINVGEQAEFFEGDLVVMPSSLFVSSDTAYEFIWLLQKTDPSVVTVSPSKPEVVQGGTTSIQVSFPETSNPDDGVCNPEAYLFGEMRDWVSNDPDWYESSNEEFGGDALEVDADCDAMADGQIDLNISVPSSVSPGTYTLDLFLKQGKRSAYRMKDVTVEVTERNDPPATPSNPSPNDGAEAVSQSPTLQWQASDPEGDSLTYDVYLGTSSSSPRLVAEDIKQSEYTPQDLAPGTTYYWKVVTKDTAGNTVSSSIWQFTVKNKDPTVRVTVSPDSPKSNDTVALSATESVDPDGTIESYEWDTDADGNFDDGIGPGVQAQLDPGVHEVSVRVTDNSGSSVTKTVTVDVDSIDQDGDGLSNTAERERIGTDPSEADTDSDGLDDGTEKAKGTDPNTDDTDGDGFTDGTEVDSGTDPLDDSSYPVSTAASLSAENTTVEPGENVTVRFELTNEGQPSSIMLDLSIPSNVTLVSQEAAAGSWKSEERKWLFRTVKRNEIVHAAITIHVPESANSSYTIDAAAVTEASTVDTNEVEVGLSNRAKIIAAIDSDNDAKIDDSEILNAIEYWREGKTPESADGPEISDMLLLELIEKWRKDKGV